MGPIAGAAGGNVTGTVDSLIQNTAIYALQSLAVTQVKRIADGFGSKDDAGNFVPTGQSEVVRGLLQGFVGCAGAAGAGGDCSSGAAGAAGSVALNNLITLLLEPEKKDPTGRVIPRSLDEQQARAQLIATLTGALVGALGGNANDASVAGQVETENNDLEGQRAKKCTSPTRTGCFTEDEFIKNPDLYATGTKDLIKKLKLTKKEAFDCLTTASNACDSKINTHKNKLKIRSSELELSNDEKTEIDNANNINELLIVEGKIKTKEKISRESDITFLGSKNAVLEYYKQGGTKAKLKIEKKAYVDAQVKALVLGFDLTPEHRQILLSEYSSNRVSAKDTVERAYALSVGEKTAFIGAFGFKYRDEIQLLDSLISLLPVPPQAELVMAGGDVYLDIKSQNDLDNLNSITNSAIDAGIIAALAERTAQNNKAGGSRRFKSAANIILSENRPWVRRLPEPIPVLDRLMLRSDLMVRCA
jgi:hypothetical protein